MKRPRRSSFRRNPSARRKPKYTGYLFLIVTEGGKTEPAYLRDLVRRWGIQADVLGAPTGNSPDSVVDFAVERMKERVREQDRRGDPEYNRVWCVFDRDRHPKQIMDKALNKASHHKIRVALSVPSVEVWFLLHFVYTARPFPDWKAVKKELNLHLTKGKYSKSQPPVDELFQHLEVAIKNAAQLRTHCKNTGVENPSTQVDLLIKQMKDSRPTQ